MPYKDRKDQLQAAKKHYDKNKEAYKARAAEAKRRYRMQWYDFKTTLKCAHCGFSHPSALDFHHVQKSSSNRPVSTLLRNSAYKIAIEEIKKCIVLCANCHRVHHHNERERKKKTPAL